MSTDYAGRSVDALNQIFDGMIANLEDQFKRDVLLLNESQAVAVYGAMVALNNVGGKINVRIEDSAISARHIVVTEGFDGEVVVSLYIRGAHHLTERYTDQNAFASKYGLDD